MPTHLARHVIFAAVAIEGLSLRPVRTFSRLHAARTACIRSFMPVEGCLPEGLLLPEQSNLTLGLPVPRTSPDHGTARDIFGRGIADPTSMIAALELALRAAAGWRSE